MIRYFLIGSLLGLATLAALEVLAPWEPHGMTHAEDIAAGYIDGTDGYWVARTGEPLDLTPITLTGRETQ
jgi:hypothetical protein